MDAVLLARLQFAFTIGFHILWPAFTIGITFFVACLSGLWWWTEKPVYGALMRFWIRIFAMGLGMGVVTGVVPSYQIGTNWSGFSRSVSNVLGPLFLYEVMTAFFLEAGFIGIVLFGVNRVQSRNALLRLLHDCRRNAAERDLDLSANSWMQTPAGYAVIRIVLRGPDDAGLMPANAVRPGLARSDPALLGAPAAVHRVEPAE